MLIFQTLNIYNAQLYYSVSTVSVSNTLYFQSQLLNDKSQVQIEFSKDGQIFSSQHVRWYEVHPVYG